MTEEERQYLYRTVAETHASLSEVALKLRLELPPKAPALKTVIKAEREIFRLKRELQRLDIEVLEQAKGRKSLSEVRRGGKVVLDSPIGGGVRYSVPDAGVAGVGASPPVRDVLFPARRQEGGIRTAAALHNLGAEAMVGRIDGAAASVGIAQAAAAPEKTMPLSPGMESCLKKLGLDADWTVLGAPKGTLGADGPLGENIVLAGTQMRVYFQSPEGQKGNPGLCVFTTSLVRSLH